MTTSRINTAAIAASKSWRSISNDKQNVTGGPSSALVAETAADETTSTINTRSDAPPIKAAVDALQMVALPSALLCHDGKVIAGNKLLAGFAPQIIVAADDFLRFQFEPGNKLISAALATARSGSGTVSRSFALPRYKEAPPAIVHLLPVGEREGAIFLNAAFLFVVTRVERSRVPEVETIKGLFNLTPAEARVAHSLATGRNIPATAKQLAVSVETIRCHVKSILSKAGMRRQTDFVAAIASVQALE